MPNGFGRGRGFGFRGASPPWPYIGIGRGGLPRCGYFFSGAVAPPDLPYQQPYSYGVPPAYDYGAPPAGPMSREQELEFLKGEAQAMRDELEKLEARIGQLSG